MNGAVVEGTHLWGQDGWCYVVQAGRPVRTNYFRRFPDPYNYPNLYDLYLNNRFMQRVGIMAPRTNAPAATSQQDLELIRILTMIWNQLFAAAQKMAGTGVVQGSGIVGGGFMDNPSVQLTGTSYNNAAFIASGGSQVGGAAILAVSNAFYRPAVLR